jgi:putative SOS response-associated peptidase YedK
VVSRNSTIRAPFRNHYGATSRRCPASFLTVIRNTEAGTEMVTMRWGMPPRPRTGGPPVTNTPQHP